MGKIWIRESITCTACLDEVMIFSSLYTHAHVPECCCLHLSGSTRSYEHTATGHFLELFSLRGDSSSLVSDDFNVVGLIFGGYEESNLSHFTHVTDLFDGYKTGDKCYQSPN